MKSLRGTKYSNSFEATQMMPFFFLFYYHSTSDR